MADKPPEPVERDWDWVPVAVTGYLLIMATAVCVAVTLKYLAADSIVVGTVLGWAGGAIGYWIGKTRANDRAAKTPAA